MFYKDIRKRLSYISFCLLRILYNSKFIIMAASLGTNAVVVTRVHCTIVATDSVSGQRRLSWACIFCKLHKGPFHVLHTIRPAEIFYDA